MKEIELSRHELFKLLDNEKAFAQGQYGILTQRGNSLYKIHYKNLIETYLSKDIDKLDLEIDSYLSLPKDLFDRLYNSQLRIKEFNRLELTKLKGTIKNVLSYKGVYVGIEIPYLKDYITLSEARKYLDNNSLNVCLIKVLEIIQDLFKMEIVPQDIKEDNIMVNLKNLDVKIIDLDGVETTFGSPNYIKKHPIYKKYVMNRYIEMQKRLMKQQNKDGIDGR